MRAMRHNHNGRATTRRINKIKGRLAMPTETAIIVASIVLVFGSFAVALAWADYYARNSRTPGAQYFKESGGKQ